MPSSVQIPTVDVVGTSTNNNAAPGQIGEYVSSTINSGSGVALISGVNSNITSISLDPGDWDVSALVGFTADTGTTTTLLRAGTNSVSATFVPILSGTLQSVRIQSSFPTGITHSVALPTARYSLAVTTTIYLLAESDFAVSTMAAFGTIAARRAR